MKNTIEISFDDVCLLRDILDTVIEDSDLRKGFTSSIGTTSRQLDRLSNRLAKKILSTINEFPK